MTAVEPERQILLTPELKAALERADEQIASGDVFPAERRPRLEPGVNEPGGPMVREDEAVCVPVRAEAQRAFHDWLKRPEILDSLAEVMAPFGLDPRNNIKQPDIERLVREGEGRYLEPLV